MNRYTSKQLLEEFRRRRFLEPFRDDCVIERTDGVDVDSLLMDEIRQWYANLIDTAPPEWLATEDVADDVVTELIAGTGAMLLTLPENVRRVVSMRIEGNPVPVTIIRDPESPLLKLQSNPFTRGGSERPVAFVGPSGTITLFAHSHDGTPPQIVSLSVVRLEEGIYQFDNRAWETVPQIKI